MNIGQVLEIHLSLAAKALGFNIATPVFDGANEIDIMDTLDLANDYVNLSWEEFETKYQQELLPEVIEYLSENRDHREVWKGVPLSRDGKVRLAVFTGFHKLYLFSVLVENFHIQSQRLKLFQQYFERF